MKHKFNTDTKALLNRIDVNSSNAKYDLKKSDLKVAYKSYSEDNARQFLQNRIG
jgi:hypothetical protein